MRRINQRYVFPILLSDEIIPAPIVYGTILPVLGWYILKTLILQPYWKDQKKREAERNREHNIAR